MERIQLQSHMHTSVLSSRYCARPDFIAFLWRHSRLTSCAAAGFQLCIAGGLYNSLFPCHLCITCIYTHITHAQGTLVTSIFHRAFYAQSLILYVFFVLGWLSARWQLTSSKSTLCRPWCSLCPWWAEEMQAHTCLRRESQPCFC